MKTLLFLLLTTITFAQQGSIMFTTQIDARNAIIGSVPTNNNPELDLTFGVALKTGNGGLQIGINYQTFKAIDYKDIEAEVGYILKYRKRWLITPQTSLKLIMRSGNKVEREINNQEFGGYKASLNVKYKIVDGFYIGADGGGTFRGDKFELSKGKDFWGSFVFDGGIEFVYEIEFK